MSDSWIRASEIGDYVYCRRAWWLRRVAGENSQNTVLLAQGSAAHAAHGRGVGRSIFLRRLAAALLLVAAAVVLAALVG